MNAKIKTTVNSLILPVMMITAYVAGPPRASGQAPVITTVAGSVYHTQIAAYSCTVACMEMQLDCTAVRTGNAFANAMLGIANPDGNLFEPPSNPRLILAPVPPRGMLQWVANPNFVAMPGPTYGGGNVTANVQTYLYGVAHGQCTYPVQQRLNPTNNCYNNPAFGFGTEFLAAQVVMNLVDNNHVYRAYMFPSGGATGAQPATLADGDRASRTVANALADYQIPGIIVIGNGAHAICVYGVRTDVAPGFNAAYEIQGFYVHDPWAGYHAQFPATPASTWGENEFVRYGWDVVAKGGVRAVLPDGTTRNVRLSDWFRNFVPKTARDPGVPGTIGAPGYKIFVEPQGPELPDDGNGGIYTSVPPAPPELPTELDVFGALMYATNALAADSYLYSQPGFMNGSFDVTNAVLLQLPTDVAGEGDWLLPYEGAGGTSEVTAFVMIDAETGSLDKAVWMNPGDVVESMALADVIAMETNNFAGNIPDDNEPAPELSMQLTATNSLALSWTDSPPGSYILEQNDSLSTTNWVYVTNAPTAIAVGVGQTNTNQTQIVVPVPPTGNVFYRLVSALGL